MSLEAFCEGLPEGQFTDEQLMKQPRVDFIEVVNSIFDKRDLSDIPISPFILLRFISMDPSLTVFAARFSKYTFLKGKLFYKLLQAILPYRERFGYYKFIKAEKKKDEMLTLLAKHFHVNKVEAKSVLAVLLEGGMAVETIEDFFGITDKKKK